MIRFAFGTGDVAVKGTYTPETGIVITTKRAAIVDLDETLQSEIDSGMLTSPHAVAGRYAMAEYVLRQWGAKVDASKVSALDPTVDY